jgi:hypothetical protein
VIEHGQRGGEGGPGLSRAPGHRRVATCGAPAVEDISEVHVIAFVRVIPEGRLEGTSCGLWTGRVW